MSLVLKCFALKPNPREFLKGLQSKPFKNSLGVRSAVGQNQKTKMSSGTKRCY